MICFMSCLEFKWNCTMIFLEVTCLSVHIPLISSHNAKLLTPHTACYRCNDVLELVQTTRHFRLLADAAEIGGAGTASLDALVREIHNKYSQAMDTFFSFVSNVLAIDGTQTFEKAFFVFRSVVKVGACCKLCF